MRSLLFVLLAAALPSAAALEPRAVRFSTPDGFKLTADFVPPQKGKIAIVFLHGLGAGRGEWRRFASTASDKGFGTLAVDFRGHGESESPSYTTFRTPDAWARLVKDVDGAMRFLEREGIPARRVCLVGASIGANLALKAAAKDGRVACLALLSPGMDYQGVRIEDDVTRFKQPMFLAASRMDPYSFDTLETLRGRVKKGKGAVFAQASQGHGAEMLDSELGSELVAWLGGIRPR